MCDMTPLEATQSDALLAIRALLTTAYTGDNLPGDIVAIIDAVAKPSSPDESKLSSFRAKAGWKFRDSKLTDHEWTEEDWRDWYDSIGQCLYRIAERKHGDTTLPADVCRKCGATMTTGKALAPKNAPRLITDEPVMVVPHTVSDGALQDVVKCPSCGHSHIP